MKVAVVILNYNGRQYLERFLPTVLAYSPQGSVYVADSASTDDSMAWLKNHHPTVGCIQLTQNYGYAGGYNHALKQVEAEYYVLLNSDVEVTQNWLSPLLQLLDNQANIAACQPKILAYHDKIQFEYAGAAGGYLDWLGFSYCRGRIFDTCETDHGQYDTTVPVFWASGACLVIRSEVFHGLGGFDADFFAHFEEIDLCWRIHLTGQQVYCCTDSTVYHVGGGTLPPSNPFKTYLNYRNSLAMLYKNLPANRLWLIIFWRLVIDGLSAVRFLPTFDFANIWAIIKAHFAFYGWVWGNLPQKRRHIWQKIVQHQPTKPIPIDTESIIWAYYFKKKRVFKK